MKATLGPAEEASKLERSRLDSQKSEFEASIANREQELKRLGETLKQAKSDVDERFLKLQREREENDLVQRRRLEEIEHLKEQLLHMQEDRRVALGVD